MQGGLESFSKLCYLVKVIAWSPGCHFGRTCQSFCRPRRCLSLALVPSAGGREVNLGFLDRCWMSFLTVEHWPAFLPSLGFELARVCVYTSCPVFSLRHTASLWNQTLIGTAEGTKVPQCTVTEPLRAPVITHPTR